MHGLYVQGYHSDDESYLRRFTSDECTMLTSDLSSDGLILPSETRQVSVPMVTMVTTISPL